VTAGGTGKCDGTQKGAEESASIWEGKRTVGGGIGGTNLARLLGWSRRRWAPTLSDKKDGSRRELSRAAKGRRTYRVIGSVGVGASQERTGLRDGKGGNEVSRFAF